MRILTALIAAGIAALPLGAQDTKIDLKVDETVLGNGMKVLVVERHNLPRVYCAVYWRVGSVNEHNGMTGISHFFEHLMFKGTATIGTTDAKRDAELNAAIEGVMGKVRDIKLKKLEADRRGGKLPAEDAARMKELLKRYDDLVAEQKKITLSEHLSKIYAQNGETGLNASTSLDRTEYHCELPSNKVELFMWLESDRFLKPVLREFYPEREVVKEERRMRYESTPTGLINEAFNAMFWQSHSYHWPTIGWMCDIDQYTSENAQEYFETYYIPENATVIVVGDVNTAEIKEMAARYFGRIPRARRPSPAVVTVESEQAGERRMNSEANAQPFIEIRWHAPSAVHADAAALDLASEILNGHTGRLYRTLVEEKKLALRASCGYRALRYGGMVSLTVHPRPETDFAVLENAICEIVDGLRGEIGDRELQKVKNQSLAGTVRELETIGGIGNALGHYSIVGDWRDILDDLEKAEKVTREDIKRVCEKYFTEKGRNVLIVKRKGKSK